jgi:hypothetical protein
VHRIDSTAHARLFPEKSARAWEHGGRQSDRILALSSQARGSDATKCQALPGKFGREGAWVDGRDRREPLAKNNKS